MVPIFRGSVRNGRICLDNRDGFQARILSLEGKRVEITLRANKEKRSSGQNACYWGVYLPAFAEHCGYTTEEMHEAFRLRFLYREVDSASHSGGLPTVRSTASLSTAEFAEYLDKIWRLAAEYGIHIPSPGDVEP